MLKSEFVLKSDVCLKTRLYGTALALQTTGILIAEAETNLAITKASGYCNNITAIVSSFPYPTVIRVCTATT